MVRWLKRKLAEWIEELITEHQIPAIEKLDDNLSDALISFNEYNEKIDIERIEINDRIEELEKNFAIDEPKHTVLPSEVLDEWFNGAKEGVIDE